MNIDINNVKIIVIIPVDNVEDVRKVICEAGAGIIGNYTYCSITTKCIGTFKPTENANPYIPLIRKWQPRGKSVILSPQTAPRTRSQHFPTHIRCDVNPSLFLLR